MAGDFESFWWQGRNWESGVHLRGGEGDANLGGGGGRREGCVCDGQLSRVTAALRVCVGGFPCRCVCGLLKQQ